MSGARSSYHNQKEKAEYLPHNVPMNLRYFEIKPSLGANHGCSTWKSITATEQFIKSWHSSQTHFANTNTEVEYCDSLNICGHGGYNVKMRHRYKLNKKSPDERALVPYFYQRFPLHWHHSTLFLINGWMLLWIGF